MRVILWRSQSGYDTQGADELTFLDITATSDGRDLILHIIEDVASQVFIPLTVGGGVRAVVDVRRLLNAGADKVSMNSSAVANPDLVSDAAAYYGSQCIVVAIDAKKTEAGNWEVFTHGGRTAAGMDVVAWASEVAKRGAGEILLTSMNRDGSKDGFDLELTAAVSDAVSVPVIASGGVGNLQRTWSMALLKAMLMQFSPPVFFIMVNTLLARQKNIWRAKEFRFVFKVQ